MSAAKMVADSTQADPDPIVDKTKKRKKRKKEKKNKRKKTKKHEKKSTDSKESDDDSDLDLEKDLKAIGDFIHARKEMLDEMFYSLRGSTLQRHIPDILKELPFETLKEKCLEQLEVMSKKRIRRILKGDDPAYISSSGTEDESTDEEQALDDHASPNEEAIVDSTSHDSNTPKLSSVEEEGTEDNNEEQEVYSDDGEIKTDSQEVNETNSVDEEEEENKDEDFSVNQMELLELEMRARAIKAMLKAQEVREKQLLDEG